MGRFRFCACGANLLRTLGQTPAHLVEPREIFRVREPGIGQSASVALDLDHRRIALVLLGAVYHIVPQVAGD